MPARMIKRRENVPEPANYSSPTQADFEIFEENIVARRESDTSDEDGYSNVELEHITTDNENNYEHATRNHDISENENVVFNDDEKHYNTRKPHLPLPLSTPRYTFSPPTSTRQEVDESFVELADITQLLNTDHASNTSNDNFLAFSAFPSSPSSSPPSSSPPSSSPSSSSPSSSSPPSSSPPSLQSTKPLIFTVASYNLRIDVDRAPHRWQDRRAGVISNIRDSNASIIGLQEAQPYSIKDIVAALPQMRVVGAWRDDSRSEGTQVMYDQLKWKILEAKTFLMGGASPKQCNADTCGTGKTCFAQLGCAKHPRTVTHLVLESIQTHEIVQFLNTHLPLKQDLQVACATQLVSLSEKLLRANPQSAVILTGDMNTDHVPLDPRGAIAVFKQAQFKDPLSWIDTPTYGPMTNRGLKDASHRLDYILYRSNTSSFESIDAMVRDHLFNGYRPSDHQMCVATFASR